MITTKDIKEFSSKLPATGLPEYLQSFNGIKDYGYIIDEKCILPFVIRKKIFLNYIQLPTTVIGALNIDQEKQFLDKSILYFKANFNADFIVTTNTSIFNTTPANSLYCHFGSYILDLKKTEDQLFAELHSKHRNVIRKAYKDNLSVLFGNEYLNDCYELIYDTFARQKMVAPSLDSIKKLMQLGENITFSVVKYNDTIHGAAIFVWNKNQSCFYLHGGSIIQTHSGAMNLLHWETILRMKKNGVHYYNFVGGRVSNQEGSRLEGIQRFKSRFGGSFVKGYYWKFVFNKFNYCIYELLIFIYYAIKGIKYEGDVIDQERKKGNY